MKNKVNSRLVNKLNEKFNIQKEEIISSYKSIIDYSTFEITDVEKDKLIKYEEQVIFHGKEIIKNNIELAKIFSEAQKTLSSNKTGTFTKWFEALGFKKTFVYMCIKRNELFLEFEDSKIFDIPEKALFEISKIKDTVTKDKIKEAIKSNKPLEAVRTLNKESFGHRTIKKVDNNIEEAQVIEVFSNDEQEKTLKIIRAEIEVLMNKLEYLRLKEIEILKSSKFNEIK
ncbi:MAG: hypothetical protein RR191_04795 [Cetobacterium sp.]|uniref:hypothetical protein n=1 Tax=Cetobacterium sp. TaxID=2071632 RepID=UPI002FCAC036